MDTAAQTLGESWFGPAHRRTAQGAGGRISVRRGDAPASVRTWAPQRGRGAAARGLHKWTRGGPGGHGVHDALSQAPEPLLPGCSWLGAAAHPDGRLLACGDKRGQVLLLRLGDGCRPLTALSLLHRYGSTSAATSAPPIHHLPAKAKGPWRAPVLAVSAASETQGWPQNPEATHLATSSPVTSPARS